jgi:hypothetical protein
MRGQLDKREEKNYHGKPFRKTFDPSHKSHLAYPDLKYFTFDHSNVTHILDLTRYANRIDGETMPICIMPDSDFPMVILRPENAPNFENNITVTNKGTYIEPLRYVIFPPLVRYWDKWQLRDDAYAMAGETTTAATTLYDWAPQHICLGIGYADQEYSPYHWCTRANVTYTPNGQTYEEVVFPWYVLPHNVHRDENVREKRRNIKLTQDTIALATAQFRLSSITEGYTLLGIGTGHQNIGTRIISLNTAKDHNDFLYDAKYFTFTLYVTGATSAIYDFTNFYIG